jgi:hypothetical protein
LKVRIKSSFLGNEESLRDLRLERIEPDLHFIKYGPGSSVEHELELTDLGRWKPSGRHSMVQVSNDTVLNSVRSQAVRKEGW